MKKYLIIAAAALTALTACSKVETLDTPENSRKISFEVAKYMVNTKALGTGTSIWGEWTSPTFYTSAYYYPTTGTANQVYMNKVQISPYQSDGTTAATTEANTAVWKSAVDYFWPKTGYINFFSFASKRDISSSVTFTDVADSETKTVSFGTAGEPIVVASDDNILLADACYNATEANAASTFTDNVTGPEEVTPGGVPTIFRHLLCQVNFVAKLSSSKAHANTSYEVDITSAGITDGAAVDPTSGLYSNGYLEATSAAKAGSNLEIQNWNTSGVQKWSNATTPAYEPVMTMTATTSPLTLATHAEASAHTSDATHTLMATRTFRPQAIASDVKFTITYVVRAKHGDETYSEETITANIALKDFTPNSGVWRCNDSVTYTINIDPVTSTITFDPAVAAWDDQAQNINIPAGV